MIFVREKLEEAEIPAVLDHDPDRRHAHYARASLRACDLVQELKYAEDARKALAG